MIPSTVEIAGGSQAITAFEKGRDLYNFHCYFCHGFNGDAQTVAASYLSPPPRDFSATGLEALSRERMIRSVTEGRENTAMAAFANTLTAEEIEWVVDFVRQAFMGAERRNTRYHTEGNGWPGHKRYAAAFPFATAEIALDAPLDALTPEQRQGRELFMSSCITCHDRGRVEDGDVVWDARAISMPRLGYSHRIPDAVSAATPYSRHDEVPDMAGLSAQQQQGESLYQANCAFCHAADGTGKNWIGRFLQPHPRDLTAMQGLTADHLRDVILDGLPGTTMPAWRNVLDDDQVAALSAYIMHVFVNHNAGQVDE